MFECRPEETSTHNWTLVASRARTFNYTLSRKRPFNEAALRVGGNDPENGLTWRASGQITPAEGWALQSSFLVSTARPHTG